MNRRAKKYKCPYANCDKAYNRPCLLEEHKRSHDNTRPFECDVCGKCFFRETHLKSHAWTHADKRPLGCPECDKRFITNQQLKRHIGYHDRKRQRESSVGNRQPSTGASKTDGSNSDHGDERPMKLIRFECPFDCAHTFLTASGLSDHLLEEHIMTDTVSPEFHVKTLNGDLLSDSPPIKQLYSELPTNDNGDANPIHGVVYNSSSNGTTPPWNGEDWSEPLCHEHECQQHESFRDLGQLMIHYSDNHEYVPNTLFQDYLFSLDGSY